jgi:hypothetical protein|tara:strand:- start:7190 stop:7330 length:141 start_codon:yes stop_codon:yes gene_type:complete
MTQEEGLSAHRIRWRVPHIRARHGDDDEGDGDDGDETWENASLWSR